MIVASITTSSSAQLVDDRLRLIGENAVEAPRAIWCAHSSRAGQQPAAGHYRANAHTVYQGAASNLS